MATESASAIGQWRLWFRESEGRAQRLSATLSDRQFRQQLVEFSRPTGRHRTRAMMAMNSMLAGLVWVEQINSVGRYPQMILATIDPLRDALLNINSLSDDAMGGACVSFVLIGRFNRSHYVMSAGWTIAATRHVFVRYIERTGSLDLDAALLTAHENLLSLRDSTPIVRGDDLFLPTLGGGLICSSSASRMSGQLGGAKQSRIVHAHTYIGDDQVRPDQRAQYERMRAGPDPLELRHTLFLPPPLYTLEHGETPDEAYICPLDAAFAGNPQLRAAYDSIGRDPAH